MRKVLTDTFEFQSFPKPKKLSKGYRRNGIPIKKIKKTLKLLKLKRPRLRVKIKKDKLPTLKKLKAKADLVFSRWIRKRDGNRCVLCGSMTNIQCGHLFKRGKHSTRFNELNCHALCNRCNFRDNFDHDIYVDWFLKKYGERKYAQLFLKSRKIRQFKRVDYGEIIKRYENKSAKI